MEIFRALRINADTRMAFVGAGGKTTAMFRAARQARTKVIVASAAHLAVDEAALADRHFIIQSGGDLARAGRQLVEGVNLVTGEEGPRRRYLGLSEGLILGIKRLADNNCVPLLIEADGSRRLPLKAPAEHEPPIPQWVNAVVVVAGLSALGKPLDESAVFRADIFSQLSGKPSGSLLQFADVCQVLTHPLGGLKNIPEAAGKILLLNQWEAASLSTEELREAKDLLLARFESIVVSSMQSVGDEVKFRLENVAGIILAAGQSERFGRPKQLLAWKGKPFIQHVVDAALQAELYPIIVVLGAVIEPIQKVLSQYPIEIINNEEWSYGQAESTAAGARAVAGRCGAAIFLLSDMPQVSVDMLREYLSFHGQNDYYILAPKASGQPANPVMFDRRCFPALVKLHGRTGGRQLFNDLPVTWLEMQDPFLALDVDTPEDYQTLISHEDDHENG